MTPPPPAGARACFGLGALGCLPFPPLLGRRGRGLGRPLPALVRVLLGLGVYELAFDEHTLVESGV